MAAVKFYLLKLAFCAIVWSVCALADGSQRKGHLQPLGSHRPAEGVTVIGKFSSPPVFYREFVRKGQPIWMRNALKNVNHFGLQNYTDDYIRENFGAVPVDVEIAKLEDRNKKTIILTFDEFLKTYKKKDLYLVHSLQNSIEEFALVPPTLACGGFQHVIEDIVMWMGSGKARSVLHTDALDNVLCLFDGRKNFILIDPKYKDAIESTGFDKEGAYSYVDVESVDMDKFPQFANVTWKSVKMEAGDCIYIPQGWFHQVTSFTQRHLAVNFWFARLYWFNVTDCTTQPTSAANKMWPISDVGFASTNEYLRAVLLKKIDSKGIMFKYEFISSLDSSTEARREQFFDAIDQYKDSALSWSELYSFDMDKAVRYFPDIFGLPGGTNSVPEDLVLYDPVPESFSSESSSDEDYKDDENDEEEEEEEEKFKNVASQDIEKSNKAVAHSDRDSDSNLKPTHDSKDKIQVQDEKTTSNTKKGEEEKIRKTEASLNHNTFQKKNLKVEL